MGNQSGSAFGCAYVRTDKPCYFSGDIVTGNIYLNIIKEGYQGQVVLLKISGKEKCNWTETESTTTSNSDGTTDSTSQTVYYTEKNNFIDIELQYRISKQIVSQLLFSHLPGSFYQKGPDYEAKISYRIKVEIESIKKQHMRNSQEITIREQQNSNITSLMGEIRTEIATCCCCDQGSTYIKCNFDRNIYLPGETANLWVEVDNSNSQLAVISIESRFINFLTLKDNQGREKIFRNIIAIQSIQGLSEGEKATGSDRRQMQLKLSNNKSGQSIKPSSNGQLIRSVYKLQAFAIMEGCICCQEDPHVEVPIQIMAPILSSYNESVQEPANWNPRVFQPSIVQFTDSTMLQKDPKQQTQNNLTVYNLPPQSQFQQMIQPMN